MDSSSTTGIVKELLLDFQKMVSRKVGPFFGCSNRRQFSKESYHPYLIVSHYYSTKTLYSLQFKLSTVIKGVPGIG